MYGRTYIVFLIDQLIVHTYIIIALGIINIKLGQLKYKEEKSVRLFQFELVEGYLFW